MLASALREAGMEVIYIGAYQTPESIVETALQEDVHIIGLSSHSGIHLRIVPKITRLLQEKKIEDKTVLVGGIFPKEDIAFLKDAGIAEVFMSSSPEEVIEYIQKVRH